MDSYLSKFEKYAVANKWDRSIWAAYLSALLEGRALEVYDRLSVADANDYEKLKDALLKNFDMTERGFRKKFRNVRPERSETFIQFGSRLRSYLDKWINMAKIENTFEAICDFMARDQFLESCSRELYVHSNRSKIWMRWLRKLIYSLRHEVAFIRAGIRGSAIIGVRRRIIVNRM